MPSMPLYTCVIATAADADTLVEFLQAMPTVCAEDCPDGFAVIAVQAQKPLTDS